jgi:hypothetical protein
LSRACRCRWCEAVLVVDREAGRWLVVEAQDWRLEQPASRTVQGFRLALKRVNCASVTVDPPLIIGYAGPRADRPAAKWALRFGTLDGVGTCRVSLDTEAGCHQALFDDLRRAFDTAILEVPSQPPPMPLWLTLTVALASIPFVAFLLLFSFGDGGASVAVTITATVLGTLATVLTVLWGGWFHWRATRYLEHRRTADGVQR